MTDLWPKTGAENNIAFRAQMIASSASELAHAARTLEREARKALQRDADGEARLEQVQAAFWYCTANGFDNKTLAVWADSLGILSGQWQNSANVQLEIQKRNIPIGQPALASDGEDEQIPFPG